MYSDRTKVNEQKQMLLAYDKPIQYNGQVFEKDGALFGVSTHFDYCKQLEKFLHQQRSKYYPELTPQTGHLCADSELL